jgi:hypothetical protein
MESCQSVKKDILLWLLPVNTLVPLIYTGSAVLRTSTMLLPPPTVNYGVVNVYVNLATSLVMA